MNILLQYKVVSGSSFTKICVTCLLKIERNETTLWKSTFVEKAQNPLLIVVKFRKQLNITYGIFFCLLFAKWLPSRWISTSTWIKSLKFSTPVRPSWFRTRLGLFQMWNQKMLYCFGRCLQEVSRCKLIIHACTLLFDSYVVLLSKLTLYIIDINKSGII